MSILKDENSNEDEQELLEVLDDVAAHVIDVSSKQDTKNDERIFSYIASIEDEDEPSAYVSRLKCISILHTVHETELSRMYGIFRGIMIDTGAARGSRGGKFQYFEYYKATGRNPDVDASRAARCHFGNGTTISVGVGNISFPIGKLWMSFVLHVVDADTLLCSQPTTWIDLVFTSKTWMMFSYIATLARQPEFFASTDTRTCNGTPVSPHLSHSPS